MDLSDLLWGGPARRLLSVATALGTFAGASVGVKKAWDTYDLPVAATRGYVHEYVDRRVTAFSDIKVVLIDLQIEQLKARRSVVEDKLSGWQSQLVGAHDQTMHKLIDQQVKALSGEVAAIDARIAHLEGQRAR